MNSTVRTPFKKAQYKKDSQFKKDCCYNQFFKLFDLRKIFQGLMFDLRNIFFEKVEKIGTFWQF